MKDRSILFCKRHSKRISYYSDYSIIITEDENGEPVYLKNIRGSISDTIQLDIFLKYCMSGSINQKEQLRYETIYF